MTDPLRIAAIAREARDEAQRAFVRTVLDAKAAGASVRRIAAAVDMPTTTIYDLLRRERK